MIKSGAEREKMKKRRIHRALLLAGVLTVFSGISPLAEAETEKDEGIYDLLLIGVDRRDDSWYGNSDVMILLTVNHDRQTVYMTSFLRDLAADIPGIGVRKLNAACANGGAKLLVETLEENYQVSVDNYAMV